MAMSQAFLPEFDQEMANTRKVLERVPEDKLTWKPHSKSPTMAWLAGHVANLPSWASFTFGQDELDLAPGGKAQQPAAQPTSRKEIMDAFEKNAAAARAAIAGAGDAEFLKPWTLLKNGQKLMTLPKVAVLRSFVLNHLIHHRAQLGVYLRLNDVPVPAIYGPSADENPMGI